MQNEPDPALSEFVRGQHRPLRNFDVVVQEKIGNARFAPECTRRGYDLRYDGWDFARLYDEELDQVTDNIAICSHTGSGSCASEVRNMPKRRTALRREADDSDREDLARCDARLDENPYDTAAALEKARLLGGLGRHGEAVAICDDMLDENPNDLNTVICKAKMLEDLGMYLDVLGLYDVQIRDSPNDAYSRVRKAELLEMFGQYEEAMRYYTEALRSYDTVHFDDPNNADYSIYRGLLSEKLGRYDEAIKFYDGMTHPLYEYHLLLRRAYLLHYTGRDRECLECVEIDADEAKRRVLSDRDVRYFDHALYVKGLFFTKIGRYDDAIGCYEQAARAGLWATQEVAVLTARGDVLAHLGRHGDAVACYDAILELCRGGPPYYSPGERYDTAQAVSRKASALYHMGRYGEAAECRAKAERRAAG